VKRILTIDNDSGAKREVARFWMEGSELRVQWSSEHWRRSIESFGIAGYDRDFRLSDGKAFYDALDAAYEHSSHTMVETT
jgi:hypothetical protein